VLISFPALYLLHLQKEQKFFGPFFQKRTAYFLIAPPARK
jgi:hypothetical protein